MHTIITTFYILSAYPAAKHLSYDSRASEGKAKRQQQCKGKWKMFHPHYLFNTICRILINIIIGIHTPPFRIIKISIKSNRSCFHSGFSFVDFLIISYYESALLNKYLSTYIWKKYWHVSKKYVFHMYHQNYRMMWHGLKQNMWRCMVYNMSRETPLSFHYLLIE